MTKNPVFKMNDKPLHAVADLSGRYAIESPLISITKKVAYTVATDGRMISLTSRPIEWDGNFKGILPTGLIKKSSSRYGKDYEVEIQMDNNENDPKTFSCAAWCHKKKTAESVKVTAVEDREHPFPPFEDLAPPKETHTFAAVSLRIDLLKKMLTSLESSRDEVSASGHDDSVTMFIAIGKDETPIENPETGYAIFEPSRKPVTFTNTFGNLKGGLLMPVNPCKTADVLLPELCNAMKTAAQSK